MRIPGPSPLEPAKLVGALVLSNQAIIQFKLLEAKEDIDEEDRRTVSSSLTWRPLSMVPEIRPGGGNLSFSAKYERDALTKFRLHGEFGLMAAGRFEMIKVVGTKYASSHAGIPSGCADL